MREGGSLKNTFADRLNRTTMKTGQFSGIHRDSTVFRITYTIISVRDSAESEDLLFANSGVFQLPIESISVSEDGT